MRRPVAQALATLGRTLLVPYAFFFFVAYGYWLTTRHIGEKALRWGQVPWWEPLGGLLTGIGPQLYVHPALWFLPALFTTALTYFFLGKKLQPSTVAVLALPVAMSGSRSSRQQGCGCRSPWTCCPSRCSSMHAARWRGARFRCRVDAVGGALAAMLLIPWLWLAWGNGRVDINQLRFGASAWKFILASLLGTSIVLFISPLAARSGPLRWMGRNTLLILCTHILVFFVLSGVASVLGLFEAGNKPGLAWALGVSAVSIVLCVPLRWLFIRYAPWALGQRGNSAQAMA